MKHERAFGVAGLKIGTDAHRLYAIGGCCTFASPPVSQRTTCQLIRCLLELAEQGWWQRVDESLLYERL
jgi:hypothetical protein